MAKPLSIPPQHSPNPRSSPKSTLSVNLQKHIKSGLVISKDSRHCHRLTYSTRLSTKHAVMWQGQWPHYRGRLEQPEEGRAETAKIKTSGVGSPLKTSEQRARWAVRGRETPKSPHARMTELFRLLRIKEADQGPSGSLALSYFQSSTGRSTLPSAQATYLRRGE